jgi:hypothetical protein
MLGSRCGLLTPAPPGGEDVRRKDSSENKVCDSWLDDLGSVTGSSRGVSYPVSTIEGKTAGAQS